MELRGPDRDAWTALAGLGVFELRIPAGDGGFGLGWVDTVAVYEVLGRHLVPGPLVWSQLLSRDVPGVGNGTRIVTGLDRTDTAIGTAEPLLVEHPALADVVAVAGPDGVIFVDPPASADGDALVPLDPLTPVGRLPEPVTGRAVADGPRAAALRAEGAVLTAALLVGIADRALGLARDYALDRQQFDRPIASFQAIQHLLADMYVRVMLARSAVHAAAALLDDADAGDRDTAVASAKIVAGDAAMANARTCIQVHGGMGFTWEMMPHYLLKRTWVLEHSFGTSAHHAERIAADLGSQA
jgi:alkylation response protein AidB-like acyl-CoA dehydrogenase